MFLRLWKSVRNCAHMLVTDTKNNKDLNKREVRFLSLSWTELCLPKVHRLKPLPPSMNIFGDRAHKEIIKVK